MVLKAAQELGRRSWASRSEEEQAAHVKMMGQKRHAGLTPEERSEIARKAAITRWAKRSVAKKKGKKRG